MKLLPYFIIVFSSVSCLSQTLKSRLLDVENGHPVSDAFIFFANTSTGTSSQDDGTFELPCLEGTDLLLIISHLNYLTKNIEIHPDSKFPDTIYLNPNELLLDQVVVAKKAEPRVRRQRENSFLKAFIGDDRKKITIENLDHLLFWEENDTLMCSADQPIIFNNELLGYKVTYFLEHFKLHPNDDVQFQGKAFFEEDLEATGKKLAQIRKNRLKAYYNSPTYFFLRIIENQIDSSQYQIGVSRRLADRTFELYQLWDPSKLEQDSVRNQFIIKCKDYFTVVNKGVRKAGAQPSPKLMPGAFGEKKSAPIIYETSYLYPTLGKIRVDQHGNILNHDEIEEFGFWATIRTSQLLPKDYTPPTR
ncbi:MAG: carboxypeptidase-like regulatory domain-containing protein [Saprospiraceae bacterium]|nr:carboxypeptidase-like regulatory domain-containing protein [Saprospiraceae bacterium]